MIGLSDEQKMAGEIVGKMIKHNVERVSNELRYGNIEVNDDDIKLSFSSSFHDWSFNFLKAFNLRLNGDDAEKMGNINEFLTLMEALYIESEVFMRNGGE